MPHILSHDLEIKGPQRPDRIPRHEAVIRHDSHDAVFDHEPRQCRQLMNVTVPLTAALRVWVAPFLAVLAAEGVELIGDSADDAFERLLAFGRGNGDDGDEIFALHFGVREGPFVVVVDCVEERAFGCGFAENLVADTRASHY